VQISQHSRGASGLAIALLGTAFVLRAVGDVGESFLSWLSPIGWAQRTYAYVDDRWWPLLMAAVTTGGLAAVGYRLSTRRDVGAGLRATRPGTATASPALVRPLGFSLRLHRGMLIGFGVGMLVLGTMYGSVYADVEGMLAGVDVLQDALADLGGISLADSFASFVMIIMSIIGSIYAVIAALRPKSEENGGRAEPVLATGLSRAAWLGSHVAVAMAGGALMVVAAGLGFGLLAAATTQDLSLLPRYLVASLAYVPAVWVTAGVAVALFGVLPRATTVAWLVPTYAFVVGYLGQILQFPTWLSNLSPFGHVPQVPAEDIVWAPLAILTLVAATLVAAGLAGFRRRDLLSTT
jgi:ABC-2 type transport system permease protein